MMYKLTRTPRTLKIIPTFDNFKHSGRHTIRICSRGLRQFVYIPRDTTTIWLKLCSRRTKNSLEITLSSRKDIISVDGHNKQTWGFMYDFISRKKLPLHVEVLYKE